MEIKTLAYLGPRGTFSEAAAHRHLPEGELLPFPTVTAVASAVKSGTTHQGIVAIENSLEGSVNDTLDMLIREPTLFITGEIVLPVEHCLLVKPGTNLHDVSVVYSHPQALGQCRQFLEDTFPNAQMIASLSTVAAVQEIMASTIPAAAVAPERSAGLYGAEVKFSNIQENPHNLTRFVILSQSDSPRTGHDKTSLCFSFEDDKPGLLYKIIGEFAQRGINLAKVESRPTKEELGRYIFLIDLDGHKEDSNVNGALCEVEAITSTFRIFGSYPIGYS